MTVAGRTLSIAPRTSGHLPTGTGVCTAKDNVGNVSTLAFDVVRPA